MSRAIIPQELYDLIVDYLHTERSALSSCALVCRAWVPASRFHLFEHVSLAKHQWNAAARLNELLASPYATFAPSVRSLEFYNALTLVQFRHPRTGHIHVKPLLKIVPLIVQFTQIRSLALSDLPFEVLSAFSKVQTLRLVGITAGPALLRLAAHLPSLTHLTLQRVVAIPYRASSADTMPVAAQIQALRRVTVRGSSIAFLGWLGVLAPYASALDLGDFCPSELPCLVMFLLNMKTPLESLELELLSGTEMREFAWDELARALGERTRLTVRVYVNDQEDLESEAEDDEEQAGEASILAAQFPKLEERGMLEFKRISG
ncbi:hypothetical protein DFH08DRAFT_1084265 [Mycena albidolilacea]|uniref:F-box domain-containing protein n=1 Tax=Mycena albidolilacea TaxID=1033008 RepID=A0AAD7EK61_9AGAR|nr:hypothetical protein DFH08DRAFT_1084265 [Mycena albidolilacea]